MHGKMIFVVLLSGYILTKAVATSAAATSAAATSAAATSAAATSAAATSTAESPLTSTTPTSYSPSGSAPSSGPTASESVPASETGSPIPGKQIYEPDFSQPVITVIIFSVMAGIIGIILLLFKLICLLIKKFYRAKPQDAAEPAEHVGADVSDASVF